MRLLLIALLGFLTLSTVFNFDPGPMPGIKIKNALLYAMIIGLFLRTTLQRYRIQLPAMLTLWGVLVGYSMATYAAIVLVIDYPGYDWLQSGFLLKNTLVDHMLLFLMFFYGLRSTEDALVLLKVLLACWALSHVMAVLDALGFVQIGDITQRGDGRVQGAVGESNQYGALVALSLPAIAAAVFTTRGLWRLFWMAAAAMTALTLIMTVSRGAFVATAVAALCALYLFRRYVSMTKLVAAAAGSLAVAMLAVGGAVALGFGDLLQGRLLGSAVSSTDFSGVSSGRTDIWASVVEVMLENPLTLLTGFGWNAYAAMPFRWGTHNYYLSAWFNLGLPGLVCSVLLLVVPIKVALSALRVANAATRPHLMGFVVGTTALAVAVFFVNLASPWLYFWAYVGIAMRIAVNALEQPAAAPLSVRGPAAPASGHRDPHGWSAVTSR
jgi:O-antigen ligase